MRNDAFEETGYVGDALGMVTRLLPAKWRVDRTEGDRRGNRRLDAIVELVAPNGTRLPFVVEAKRSGSVPVQFLVPALRAQGAESGLPVLFVSDYIGPALRTVLTEGGINFADATGWARLASDDPLVLLTGQGAERSPKPRHSHAVIRLNGLAASRTIRALSTVAPPVGVRDLGDRAGVSPGSVSKILATLATEGIVDRDPRGRVTVVRRRTLIRRWVRDYDFAKTNKAVAYFIAPRGLAGTLARLKQRGGATLTGPAAARRLLPDTATSVVPLRLVALYAASPGALARDLDLIDADPATANVVIAAPQDPLVLRESDGRSRPVAPVALVLADLLTLPNRSDAEAEQLMDALAIRDVAWKD
jgi:hypothetical protein